MLAKITVLLSVSFVLAEVTVPTVETTVSEGVKSLGYQFIYGDDDLEIYNEVVNEMESASKSKVDVNDHMPPLPAQDVKCLMSVDRYCSKDMLAMKGVLIQALQEDCAKCTSQQKDAAGKVIAAMMIHDPVAWKMFLTRSALVTRQSHTHKPERKLKFKVVGRGEVIEDSPFRHTLPGFKVRVKRFVKEKISE